MGKTWTGQDSHPLARLCGWPEQPRQGLPGEVLAHLDHLLLPPKIHKQ